ncbi:MAG TPA: hydroxymethylbilane synthase [Vicinamibacterales bacterium]|nr:hydroxymethylbilane synthase [Vicinamibacterales bacterium]
MSTLRLGTRGSQLALVQATTVAALLKTHAGLNCEIVVIKTSGDRLADAALSVIGGKRLFVKEIEDALLAGDVDLAVHSSKDLPAILPDGLEIAAVLPREDPRDAIILPPGRVASTLEDLVRVLGPAPRIGTSSVRRIAQLTGLFPGAGFLPIRGNLDTRLRKLDAGDYDALVLAAAGLRRLDHAERISMVLPVDACVPAPGQGIIAVEIRGADVQAREHVMKIDEAQAHAAFTAERAVVVRLGGGCQMPIGAYAEIAGDKVHIAGIVVSLDGARTARADATGSIREPESAGTRVAEALLTRGADEILADAQRRSAEEGQQP